MTEKMPEKIWLMKSLHENSPVFTMDPMTINDDGEGSEQYIRSDIHEALTAERDMWKEKYEELELEMKENSCRME
jgi:hypothetical protein